LAFSTQPIRKSYLVHYNENFPNKSYVLTHNEEEIFLDPDQNSSLTSDVIELVTKQITDSTGVEDITILNLEYKSTHTRCFADTAIISETIREILKNTSNKVFYALIGIVTVFYTITYVLALHRQNPRIRALKKSLNVLNKFNARPTNHHQQEQRHDSIVSSYSPLYSKVRKKFAKIDSKRLSVVDNQQYEMSSFISNDDIDEQNILNKPKTNSNINISDGIVDDLNTSSHERYPNVKQVSFQVDNSDDTLNQNDNQCNCA